MRFNAVIAAYILAATVSGAALPVAEDSTAEVAAPTEEEAAPAAPEGFDFPEGFNPEDFDFDYEEFEKRSADPSADPEAGWTWRPWRPVGMPAKRNADAEAHPEAGWTWRPWRPVGMPAKRDAEAEAGWTWRPWRPVGLPVGKRDAMPEAYADAEAHPEAGWTWRPWRPVGMPAKRDAEAEAGWTYRPYRPVGLPAGKREAEFRA